MKIVAGFIAGILVTYLLGAAFVSQGNIAAVTSMGFEITFSQRIDAVIHDITHMYDLYLPVVTVAMLIALSIAGGIIRFTPTLRLIGYASAGFVGMIAMHVIFKAALGASGIAPTREIVGLVLQGVAGGLGGLAFHYISLKTTTSPATAA
ncbi:MAG: hypothetical protein ACI82A_004385 [Candidatus Azotimanducaceae bacterium]|jgi:hypothetical protein